MLKCSIERWVCAPQSLSAGTSTAPRLSVSFRMSAMGGLLDCSVQRNAGRRQSNLGDVDDRVDEGLRRLLRQVVPDAAGDRPVRIAPREFLGVGGGRRMRRAIGF